MSAGATHATTGVEQENIAEIAAPMGLGLPPEARRAQAAETTPATGVPQAPAVRRGTDATISRDAARGPQETAADPTARRTRGDLEASAKITERTHRGATRIAIHGATIDARPDRLTVGIRWTRVGAEIRHETTKGPTGAGKAAETSANSGAVTGARRPGTTDATAAPHEGFDATSHRAIPARAGHQNGASPSPSRSNAPIFPPVSAAPEWGDPIRNS
jgi:hypothetical protein